MGQALIRGEGLPKSLINPASSEAIGQISFREGVQVTAIPGPDGVAVTIKAGEEAYPGITIKPTTGPSWDLRDYGHVEVKITNTGSRMIDLNLRVDNEGEKTAEPWNAESKNIGPGQTGTLRVCFGYSYGFKPGFKLNPAAVTDLQLFTRQTTQDLSFRIVSIGATGSPGEKVGVALQSVARKPEGGILLGPSAPITTATQISASDGAKGSPEADGKSLRIDFSGGKQESVTLGPADGLWNLNEDLEVKVRLKNIGQTPITPSAQMESEAGAANLVTADAPLPPGAETELHIPFAAQAPWQAPTDPRQQDPKAKASWNNPQPNTGTLYRSHLTSGVTILSDMTAGAKTLLVSSIRADRPTEPILPAWLGQKPPVEGDWTQTLDEEFPGNAIDLHRWNVHGPNWWDKRMHFSKDQVIVKDGLLALRLEKKPGYNNDDSTGKISYSGARTDYAAGQVDTYGKWTQRYGYFELREKQSAAKCLWPGFWMMPDRGRKPGYSDGKRWETGHGGMEFDVTESQSLWGIDCFHMACHWDDYEATHKRVSTSGIYVQADHDGFIVVGLLWLPGSVTGYGNGKEIFHWESPRVASVQEFLLLQNEIGGWDNEPVDDAQLPADFNVKYLRVWQRKDLATPEDGPKPNKGDFDAFHE